MKTLTTSTRATAPNRRRLVTIRLLVVGVLAATVVFGAARASATPAQGVTAQIVARGVVAQKLIIGVPATKVVRKRVRIRVAGTIVTKRVRVRVRTVRPLMRCRAAAPCDTAFQQLRIAPGGTTGWHTHPGPTFVAVERGAGRLYHARAGCPATTYGPNSGFFQRSADVHTFRNEGTGPLDVWAFYLLPSGTPNTGIRIDQPQPADCPNVP